MLSLEVALAFFGTAILLALAPGPDNIFVLTQSAVYGARAGIVTTLGLASGLCIQTLAVALGVAVIFKTSPVAFLILKCFGCAYLLYLAWGAFRASATLAHTNESAPFPGLRTLYVRGIVMNITNPKVCLFFLAFLPQFCDPAKGRVGLQITFLGLLFIIATLIVFFCVAFLGGRLANWFNSSRQGQLMLNRCAGVIFLGMAGALVLSGQ